MAKPIAKKSPRRTQPTPASKKAGSLKTPLRKLVTKAKKAKPSAPKSEAAPKARKVAVRLRKKLVKRAVPRSLSSERKGFAAFHWAFGVFGVPFVLALVLWKIQHPISQHDQAQSPVQTPPTMALEKTAQAPSAEAAGPMDKEFAKATALPFAERIAFWSGKIAEPRFTRKLSTLGKGPEISDSAPWIPAKFDCTTFVETAMALSRSSRPAEFFDHLMSIRYKEGKGSFIDRNHFPEADWMPNNIRAGYLRDITLDVAGKAGVMVAQESKTIDRGSWFNKLVAKGKLNRTLASGASEEWLKPLDVTVQYLDVRHAEQFAGKIPSGAILNLVRKSRPTQPVLITHQGFVIQENGQTYLRHSLPTGNIYTVPLVEYLQKLKADSAPWPLLGVHLAEPLSSR